MLLSHSLLFLEKLLCLFLPSFPLILSSYSFLSSFTTTFYHLLLDILFLFSCFRSLVFVSVSLSLVCLFVCLPVYFTLHLLLLHPCIVLTYINFCSTLLILLYSLPSTSTDPCVNAKCNFGAECRAGRCICPSDCPTDLIQPVCLLVPTTSSSPSSDPSLRRLPHKPFATECEMRASVCKNGLDIDADSFIYGDCPQDTHQSKVEDAGNHHNDVTASSVSPQDTHHSNQGEDKRNDDGSSLPASSSISPLPSSSKKDGVKFPSFSGNNDDEEDEGLHEDTVEGGVRGEDDTEEGSGDDGYSTGHEDDDEDEEEDNDEDERRKKVFVENKKKSEEDDGLYKSLEIELCHHLQCPIGSFCRIRKRRQHESAPYSSTHTALHQNANHEAFCDCHQMCSRINDLDLETPGWIREEVCGSNGLLYRNECQLRQESCQRDQVISLTTKSNCNGTFAQPLDHTSSPREVKKTHTSSLTPAVTSLHWGLPSSSSFKKNKTKDHNEGDQESGGGVGREVGRGVGKKAKERWKQKNDNNQENRGRDITNHNHHHQGNDHKKRNQSHFDEEGKKKSTLASLSCTPPMNLCQSPETSLSFSLSLVSWWVFTYCVRNSITIIVSKWVTCVTHLVCFFLSLYTWIAWKEPCIKNPSCHHQQNLENRISGKRSVYCSVHSVQSLYICSDRERCLFAEKRTRETSLQEEEKKKKKMLKEKKGERSWSASCILPFSVIDSLRAYPFC